MGFLAFLFLADLADRADFELPIPDSHEASGETLGLFPLKRTRLERPEASGAGNSS
ncbi:hypothetical protein [Flavobacterium sp. KMS]|uniref:hypothetical protein n=1 Tax=Flavobacterium sp. KMS TaxID=1566023 RepID=UPI0013F40A9D|nr:hypothetical protein [Flavobacterium sp. KMS]